MDLGDISTRWKELHGQPAHWLGLLDPLDPDLRRHILLYGNMAQASYDAFIQDELSPHAGQSRYAPHNFFARAGLQPPGTSFPYKITRFLYATSTLRLPLGFLLGSLARDGDGTEVNFTGYVAVSTDEGVKVLGRRDIVVVWRGTVQKLEWANDLDFMQVTAAGLFPNLEGKGGAAAEVHHGWMSFYMSNDPDSVWGKKSAREQAVAEVQRLVNLYKDEQVSITVTGHSLGGALATLNAADIAANGYSNPTATNRPHTTTPVTAIVFASPRVGDAAFQQVVDDQPHLRVLRVRNDGDIVPSYPFTLPTSSLDYADVGHELSIDTAESPFLKGSASKHSLEIYLHGVAGVEGSGRKGFKLAVARDISLVNKHEDALKDEYRILPEWWIEKNNGMVLGADGKWSLTDDTVEDDGKQQHGQTNTTTKEIRAKL